MLPLWKQIFFQVSRQDFWTVSNKNNIQRKRKQKKLSEKDVIINAILPIVVESVRKLVHLVFNLLLTVILEKDVVLKWSSDWHLRSIYEEQVLKCPETWTSETFANAQIVRWWLWTNLRKLCSSNFVVGHQMTKGKLFFSSITFNPFFGQIFKGQNWLSISMKLSF